MKTSNQIALATVLLLLASWCLAKEPMLYSLVNGSVTAQPEARVMFQRTKNSGALLLLSFDGVDPRSYPSMSEYAELVRKGEARIKAGEKPGMISFSPGRNEPQLVAVTPGIHKYGVLYYLIANVRAGVLLDSPMAKALGAEYLPRDMKSDKYTATVKRYEDISFTAVTDKNYRFGYSWTKDALDLHITLEECSKNWKDCSPIPFQSENAQTKVIDGVSDQEI